MNKQSYGKINCTGNDTMFLHGQGDLMNLFSFNEDCRYKWWKLTTRSTVWLCREMESVAVCETLQGIGWTTSSTSANNSNYYSFFALPSPKYELFLQEWLISLNIWLILVLGLSGNVVPNKFSDFLNHYFDFDQSFHVMDVSFALGVLSCNSSNHSTLFAIKLWASQGRV